MSTLAGFLAALMMKLVPVDGPDHAGCGEL